MTSDLQVLLSAAIAVGMMGGLAFGNIACEAINQKAKRWRARAAWIEAWRSDR